MKNAMKKLLSLMLVAVLLVSAVPFQASASSENGVAVKFSIGDKVVRTEFYTDSDTVTANEVAAHYPANGPEKGDFIAWYETDENENRGAQLGSSAVIEDGVIYVELCYKPAKVADDVVVIEPVVKPEEEEKDDAVVIEPVKPEGDKGEAQPEGEPMPDAVVTSCKLTIDYKLSGYEVNTVNASVGKLYKEFVGVPARGGYDFLGWYSEDYNRIIDINKDILRGNDTITGMWSAAKKFSLTLDENRAGEEVVNKVKSVTYGEKIGTLPTPERKGYVFAGWKLNGTIITANTVWELQGDGVAYAQWKLESDTEDEPMGGGSHVADGKVYLEIYAHGDTQTRIKRVDITKYADDDIITQKEARKVADDYVTAKNGYTMKYELFDEAGWWEYTHDDETDGEDYVVVNRDGDDYVYMMATNVNVVQLKIYLNGNTKSAAKIVDMIDYAKDGKITLSEATKVVNKYYEQARSDDDMDVDGLFVKSTWNNGKYDMADAEDYIKVDEDDNTIIYVMVRDAKKISSGTADSSNPKTGDTIFMAVTVMALSATALAAVYVFNKKRAVK